MKTVIGKNTLGGGKKMVTSLTNYNRSTHDLSFVMRTTMAPGVLVPTMKLLMEPGDTFDISARYHTLTHPTIGPLFGSFKQQNDYFFCPIRLYNAMLHNNTLNVGLNMKEVKLPKMKWKGTEWTAQDHISGSNKTIYKLVHPSSLLAYLGYRSLVRTEDGYSDPEWQCVPVLAYYDIFKNYYANKQEEKFYTIDASQVFKNMAKINDSGTWVLCQVVQLNGVVNDPAFNSNSLKFNNTVGAEYPAVCINFTDKNISIEEAYFSYTKKIKGVSEVVKGTFRQLIIDNKIEVNHQANNIEDVITTNPLAIVINLSKEPMVNEGDGITDFQINLNNLGYRTYNLSSIDELRENILAQGRKQFYINQQNAPFIQDLLNNDGEGHPTTVNPMAGLCLKTYQSDINNNWVRTEWIDGDNGINEITAIDTSKGSFSIDQLNLAEKVYKMLNRIAISDGTYNAWIQTIFTSGGLNHIETPIYLGGQSQEIEFQEVVSQSSTENEPLGSLAGRGEITQRKGGNIKFKADEPGYIICISSLTPRVDYFQGNEWDVYLENLDQLHKPQLDGIGFQDRLYRYLNTSVPSSERKQSIGKQPAWIEYMTNVNKTFGNFALIENEGWMCLNRIFDSVRTYTTYVQPHMYNNIFADTDITSQNFWVQIAFNIKARRVMSAKQIPNL